MLNSNKIIAAINGEPLDDEVAFKESLTVVSANMELRGQGENFMGLT